MRLLPLVAFLGACGSTAPSTTVEDPPLMEETSPPAEQHPAATAAEEPGRPRPPSETMSPDDLAAVRPFLAGVELSDAQVVLLHRALLRSDTDYTEDGLRTLAEWELYSEIGLRDDGRWEVFIAGARVNAEWRLYVDPETGAVEAGPVATLAEEPRPP